MTTPSISVIVPTHNRREPLMRLLRALERQRPVPGGFEVFVVVDGGTDDTPDAINSTRWPFSIRVLEQSALGPSAARNHGASQAAGRTLLFLDDDVEPHPDVVRAHHCFHSTCANAVGVGDLPPVVHEGGLFGVIVRGWWEGMYDGPREPGHRYVYRDLLSGHFSIARSAFNALGGFDSTLRCHEDYELGYRVIESGMTLRFVPDAIAWHHERSNLTKLLRRKYDEGIADVQLLRRSPEMRDLLPLSRPLPHRAGGRLLLRLAWERPALGDFAAKHLESMLRPYESARLRFRWRGLLETLIDYWYWRGVACTAGGRAQLESLLAAHESGGEPEFVLDLAGGLDVAKARLDAARPQSIRLRYGAELIGDVPRKAGAERLSGAHLPRLIAREFATEFLYAAGRAGALPSTLPEVDRHRAAVR